MTGVIGSLVADVLALLLEPLGVDASFGGDALFDLAMQTASFDTGAGDDEIERVGRMLTTLVAQAAARTEARKAIRGLASLRERHIDVADADRCLTWLAYVDLGDALRGLEGVPSSILSADANEVVGAERRLRPCLERMLTADRAWPGELKRSVVTLDLDETIAGLRDKGFWWVHTRSDAARDRVLEHAAKTAEDLTKSQLATLLTRAGDMVRATADFDELVKGTPDWWLWLAGGHSYQFSTERRDAVLWVIARRDLDALVGDTVDLLASGFWRALLHESRYIAVALTAPTLETDLLSLTAARLRSGLALPHEGTMAEIAAWVSWAKRHVGLLGRCGVVLDRRGEPIVDNHLRRITENLTTPFGPLDTSRAEYRRVQANIQRTVDWTLRHAGSVHPIGHNKLLDVFRMLGQLERMVRSSVATTPAVQGMLTIAIAGRTKSGKTTLRKALTRDPDRTGIGRGAQRTTRDVSAFELDAVRYLDTPGVAAYDDDFDADQAMEACASADAVLWNYADTLRVEEAEHVLALLADGKPLIVVVNIKWRVDTAARLAIFAQYPQLAFRHEEGHAQRIHDIADSIDTPTPVTIRVHAGAAQESLTAADQNIGAAAMSASRLPQLEQHLRHLLADRAVPLRAVRLADNVRGPLAVADALLDHELPQLLAGLSALERTAGRQQRDLLEAIDAAGRHARAELAARRANANQQLRRVVRTLGGADSDAVWHQFIDGLDLTGVFTDLENRFASEVERAGRTLKTEYDAETRSERTRLGHRRMPGNPWWKRALRVVGGAAWKVLKGFAGRGFLIRAAEGGGLPWVLIAQVAVDAFSGAATALSRDIDEVRQREHDWTNDASRQAETELAPILFT